MGKGDLQVQETVELRSGLSSGRVTVAGLRGVTAWRGEAWGGVLAGRRPASVNGCELGKGGLGELPSCLCSGCWAGRHQSPDSIRVFPQFSAALTLTTSS